MCNNNNNNNTGSSLGEKIRSRGMRVLILYYIIYIIILLCCILIGMRQMFRAFILLYIRPGVCPSAAEE